MQEQLRTAADCEMRAAIERANRGEYGEVTVGSEIGKISCSLQQPLDDMLMARQMF